MQMPFTLICSLILTPQLLNYAFINCYSPSEGNVRLGKISLIQEKNKDELKVIVWLEKEKHS